jgi:hypothetical protein
MASESIETVGLSSIIALLYAVFFYWYASRNRKIDVYVKPRFLNWQVRTGLLAVGTAVIIFVEYINFMVSGGVAQPFAFPFLLGAVFFAVVVWHGPLFLLMILGILVMVSPLFGTALPANAYQIYLLDLAGIIPVMVSLVISAEAAIDTLVFRIQEEGEHEAAELVDQRGRIGLSVVLWGIILPGAVFTRWIRRGTKPGKIHVIIASRMLTTRTIMEKYVEVILPEMRTD